MSSNVENVSTQIEYAQYYMMIYSCTAKSYEHILPIIEKTFHSSLFLLRNGFVLGRNVMNLNF